MPLESSASWLRPEVVYNLVPAIMVGLLGNLPMVSGFVLEGSFAARKYQPGDDIDFDILFENYYPEQPVILEAVKMTFAVQRLAAHIRAPLVKASCPEAMRKVLYIKHLNSPYIVQNQQVARDWGLIQD